MKKITFVCFFILAVSVCAFGQSAKLKVSDLQILTGAKWVGNLNYLDYGKNSNVSIPSTLSVMRSEDDNLSWVFDYKYPDEPKADSKETVKLSNDGKTFNGEKVIERTKLKDKTIKIVLEKSGTDNDKKALFHYIYLLNKNSFSIRKEVKYEGENNFFVRNEYSWKR